MLQWFPAVLNHYRAVIAGLVPATSILKHSAGIIGVAGTSPAMTGAMADYGFA
jgi:hypothetical protein